MDEWDEEFEAELEAARQEAEENGEEFDEEEWLEERRLASGEEDEWSDDFEEDDSNDPWTEDDHEQRSRRRSGGRESNQGLRQAEQNAGDFYNYAHMEDEDGHGISVPQLTAFDRTDDEKSFRRPETPDERHTARMERVARKYEKNEDPDYGFDSDDDQTAFDDWVETNVLSSREDKVEEEEYGRSEDKLVDYEDDIIAKARDRIIEFFADGKEEEHYRRLRDDTRYVSSADREYYDLHRELAHKLELYEDRMAESPHDNDLYLPFVHGAMEVIDNAHHLYSNNRERQEELKEMRDSGELSEMQYQDQSIALDYNLQRRLTNNQYAAISGGGSMFGDVGEIMDRWNNLVDDTVSGDPETLQNARDFIGQLPREVANKLIDEAVDEGILNRSQANHLMTMAARPTNSLSGTPSTPKKNSMGSKFRKWLGW